MSSEQRSSHSGNSSPGIYAEIQNEQRMSNDPKVQTSEVSYRVRRRNVSQEATIPEIDSDDVSMTSPSPTCVMLMQTPEQEQTCSRHLVVANNTEPKKSKGKKKTSSTSSQPDQVFYTIASYDSTMEYRELDPKTLSWHYGEVTPYGTVTPTYVETDGRAQSRASGAKSPQRESSSSFGTSIYSSLLRTTDSGVHKVKLGQRGIYYIDFLPKTKKENFYKNNEYMGFE